MINIHFTGDSQKPEKMQIHKGIIKDFQVLNQCLIINFKRSKPLGKKKDTLTGFEWIWTKHINLISNYREVLAFLKSLDLNGNPSKAPEKENTQTNLF